MPLFLCCWPCTVICRRAASPDGTEEVRMQICNGSENGSRSRQCGGEVSRGRGRRRRLGRGGRVLDVRLLYLRKWRRGSCSSAILSTWGGTAAAAARRCSLACMQVSLASHTPGIRQCGFVPLPRTRLYRTTGTCTLSLVNHVTHVCMYVCKHACISLHRKRLAIAVWEHCNLPFRILACCIANHCATSVNCTTEPLGPRIARQSNPEIPVPTRGMTTDLGRLP